MQYPTQYHDDTTANGTKSAKPAWLFPAIVIVLIAAIYFGGKRREEVAENALVDILVLTVGVLAFAHLGKWLSVKLGSPGAARFFSLNYTKEGQ